MNVTYARDVNKNKQFFDCFMNDINNMSDEEFAKFVDECNVMKEPFALHINSNINKFDKSRKF